jgi:hypothetical protein
MQKSSGLVSVSHFHPSVTSNLLTRVLLYEQVLSLYPQILDLSVSVLKSTGLLHRGFKCSPKRFTMDVLTFLFFKLNSSENFNRDRKIQLIIQHIAIKERWTEHCPYHLSRLQDRVVPVTTVNIMASLPYQSKIKTNTFPWQSLAWSELRHPWVKFIQVIFKFIFCQNPQDNFLNMLLSICLKSCLFLFFPNFKMFLC